MKSGSIAAGRETLADTGNHPEKPSMRLMIHQPDLFLNLGLVARLGPMVRRNRFVLGKETHGEKTRNEVSGDDWTDAGTRNIYGHAG